MRLPFAAIALAACALAAAGCGDDDSDDGAVDGGEPGDAGQAVTRLRLAADPTGELAFNKTSLSAEPGRVVIMFNNPSQVPHAVEVEGNGVEEETETITEGSAGTTRKRGWSVR